MTIQSTGEAMRSASGQQGEHMRAVKNKSEHEHMRQNTCIG